MAPLPPPGLNIRLAEDDDLGSIVRIHEEAYRSDADWCNRYLYRDQYPGDHLDWVIREYRSYMRDPAKYRIYIVTAKDYDDQPISFAVWDLEPLREDYVGKLMQPMTAL
jgi:hypothetical protein